MSHRPLTQPPTIRAPLSADLYSESIEQRFAIVRDFLLRPVGAALLADDPSVRRGAAPSAMARNVATRVYRSTPLFVTTESTRAIFAASCSLPEYTSQPSSLSALAWSRSMSGG